MHPGINLQRLRAQAEARLAHPGRAAAPSEVDAVRVLHELQVHQIELEMQNEALLQAQAQTQKALQGYTDLFDLAPVGYLNFDREGNICRINVAGAALLGAAPVALLGRRFLDFLQPEARPHAADLLEQAYATRRRHTTEFTLVGDDPLRPPVRVQLEVQADAAGVTERVVLVDITAAQRLNAELLLERGRSEAATHTKRVFLSTINQELRTPMNAIIGCTQLLQRESPTPQQSTRLGHIGKAAQHLLGLVNSVLDLTQIEAGQFELDKHDFSWAGLLSQVDAQMRATAQAKGLDFTLDGGDVPLRLHGDAARLTQALVSLLSNACKFTDSGSVGLHCRLEENTPRGVLVRFEVRDTGTGLTQAQMAGLFTPFVQADAPIRRLDGGIGIGLGLGLALTRELAELMGGTVGALSVAGAGSVFWFTARLRKAAAANG